MGLGIFGAGIGIGLDAGFFGIAGFGTGVIGAFICMSGGDCE
jgi:hypothetical protein